MPLLPLLLLLLLTACTHTPPTAHEPSGGTDYASLLEMEETDSCCIVKVKDAWHPERIQATYLLIPSHQPLPQQLPPGTVVRTPLPRVVLLSSVHASLLADLQAASHIAGMADTAYVVGAQLRQLLAQGVCSVGNSLNPDVETIRALCADAVFVSPFENAGHGSLEQLGIPLIECADYMETSPLGRAEWMRFFGRLVGQGPRADSLFQVVAAHYLSLREKASRAHSVRPTVFCDLRTGGTWYQPGGNSTMGQFLTDAGAHYLWADRPESGSLPLDMESVFARAHRADLWLVKYGATTPLTYDGLAKDCPAYTRFAAWKERRVWACNTLQVAFYEEVPFHPDRLLQSLIGLFHPELADSTARPFYTPLPAPR